MTSEFDSLLDDADTVTEEVMGEPIILYHGDIKYPVQAIVDRSADAVQPRHSRMVRLKNHTVLLELRASQLPSLRYSDLEAIVDGERYHVVDDDLDNGWLLLALAKMPASPVSATDITFINHD